MEEKDWKIMAIVSTVLFAIIFSYTIGIGYQKYRWENLAIEGLDLFKDCRILLEECVDGWNESINSAMVWKNLSMGWRDMYYYYC